MTISELFRVSSSALTRHKLRAFLTLLGVIIGVATVVGVVSVISGLNSYVKDKVIGLNPDIVIFDKYGIITSREEWLMARKRRNLTLTDMEVVRRECRRCQEVGARGERRRPVKYERPDALRSRHPGPHAEHERGPELRHRQRALFHRRPSTTSRLAVAIIGWDVQDELFPNVDPIGRMMKIDGYPVRVIGTLAKKGSVLGQSQDNVVYIPLSVFNKHIAPGRGHRHLRQAARRRRGRQRGDRRGAHDPALAAQDRDTKATIPSAWSRPSCSRRSGAASRRARSC